MAGTFLGGLASGAIGGAVVNLVLNDKQFNAGLAGAEAKTKGSTTAMGGAMNSLKSIGVTAFAAVGAAALAGAAKAVQAASDQEEALNKARVVFGQSSSAIEAFAETSATSLGLSETAALSATATFGNFFSAAGLASGAISDMSQGVVTLASDLASFNNIDPTEALEKLRAGLAGEAEPMRQLGVFISEARTEQEAYASGLAEVGEELTDAEKIQARYNIILQDTTLAQGDFARTSDSLANQQRILAAEVENLAADVGKALLPAVSDLVGAFASLVPVLSALAPVLTTLIGLAKELLVVFVSYKVLSNLTPMLLSFSGALRKVGFEAAATKTYAAAGSTGLNNVAKSAGAVTGALAAAMVVFEGTNALMGSLAVNAESLGEAFPHVSEAFRNTAEDIKNSGWADFGAFIADPFATSGTRAEEFTATGAALVEQGRALGLTYKQANVLIEENSDALNYNRKSQEGFTEAVEGSLDVLQQQIEGLGKGDISMQSFTAELHNMGFTTEEAFAIAHDALDQYGKDVKQTGKVVKQFAGLTDDELKDFRASTKEAFAVAGESVFGFKAKFEGSVRSFIKGLDNMRKRAQETFRDLREFNKIDLGEGIKKFLLDQGPAAIDRFVDANKQGRANIVDDIKVILETQKKNGEQIDIATGKTNDLTGAMTKLGQKKVTATAYVKYALAEGSLDPGQLPGLAQGNP